MVWLLSARLPMSQKRLSFDDNAVWTQVPPGAEAHKVFFESCHIEFITEIKEMKCEKNELI